MRYSEAAEVLGISERALRQLKHDGAIGFNRPFGSVITFSQHQLDEYRSRVAARPRAVRNPRPR